jgi:hypothetical protein
MRVTLLLASLALAPACVPSSGAKSRMASGDSYLSGEQKFDEFFTDVSNLRFRADETNGDKTLREKVSKSVGLEAGGSRDETIAKARARSEELKKGGGKFFVVLAPQPQLVLKNGAETNKDAASFAKTIEEVIREGIDLAENLDRLSKDAQDLEKRAADLKDSLSSFEGEKRAEVERELEGSVEVLQRSRLRAEGEAGRALRYVVLLASAVDSGAAAELLALQVDNAAKQPKAQPKWVGKAGAGGGKPKGGGKKKPVFDP